MELELSIKNCFGIGAFDESFDLSIDNVTMIYAPNGTMKTSLARTFLCLENNHNAADLIDNTKESSYSFKLDGNNLTHNQIYVYKTEDNQIEPNGIYHLEYAFYGPMKYEDWSLDKSKNRKDLIYDVGQL